MAPIRFPIGGLFRPVWTKPALLALLATVSVVSAAPSSSVITLAMPIGARQMAMGESGTALAEDPFAVWWNPAGLAVGPVADEWQLTLPHTSELQVRKISAKHRKGFLGSTEIWGGHDGGVVHYKEGHWREWWRVNLDENQTVRGVLKRFLGHEEGLDTLMIRLREFNGIKTLEEEEEMVEVKIPWSFAVSDTVTAIHYERSTDRVWVGTVKGLWVFDGAGWKKYRTEIGERRINAIRSAGATVWIGTDDGLFRFRQSLFARKGTVFGKNQDFTALAWSETHRELWVGIRGAGVARLQPASEEGGKDKWALFGTADGLLDTEILQLRIDPSEHIWALHADGLSHFTRLRWEQVRIENTTLTDLAIDPRGTLWITSLGGVWRHDPYYSTALGKKSELAGGGDEAEALGKWAHYHTGNGLRATEVFAAEPADDDLWFVSQAGVERYHRARRQVGFFYENILPRFNIDDLYHLGAVGTFPLGDWGTIGGFINFVSFGESTIEADNAAAAQTFNSTEVVAGLSYGTKLTPRQSLGVAFQFLYSDLSSGIAGQKDATTASYAVTVGWLMRDLLIPRLNAGVVLANMGPDVFYVDKSQSDPIPLTWRFGLAWTPLSLTDHRIVLSSDYSRESVHIGSEEPSPFYVALWKSWIDPESARPGSGLGTKFAKAFQEGTVGFGAEYVYANTLALRLGYLHDYPFSGNELGRKELDMGVGLMISDLWQLDIAMIKELNGNDARDGQARVAMIFKF